MIVPGTVRSDSQAFFADLEEAAFEEGEDEVVAAGVSFDGDLAEGAVAEGEEAARERALEGELAGGGDVEREDGVGAGHVGEEPLVRALGGDEHGGVADEEEGARAWGTGDLQDRGGADALVLGQEQSGRSARHGL